MTTLIATMREGNSEAMSLYAEYEILYYQNPPCSIDYLNCMAAILLMPMDVLETEYNDSHYTNFLQYLKDQIQILYNSRE